jgi:predicted component of type VI protein secretion system
MFGIWIFSEVALGSGAGAAVTLDRSLPAVAGRIHYFDGGFWLEVPDDGKSVVTLDRRRRSAGDIVPLQSGHELRLGDVGFEVKLL